MVMQRLHEDDLAGRLLEKGGWHHFKIAAIAEQDEQILIGPRRIHKRKAGTVIDPQRESLEDLQLLRQSMGELFFSAQYQQEPIPLPAMSSRPNGLRNTTSLRPIPITTFWWSASIPR
jgi:hypothetical protein